MLEITKYNRTNSAGEIKANYEKFEQKDVSVAGRIIAKRIILLFLDFGYFDFLAFYSLLFFITNINNYNVFLAKKSSFLCKEF